MEGPFDFGSISNLWFQGKHIISVRESNFATCTTHSNFFILMSIREEKELRAGRMVKLISLLNPFLKDSAIFDHNRILNAFFWLFVLSSSYFSKSWMNIVVQRFFIWWLCAHFNLKNMIIIMFRTIKKETHRKWYSWLILFSGVMSSFKLLLANFDNLFAFWRGAGNFIAPFQL